MDEGKHGGVGIAEVAVSNKGEAQPTARLNPHEVEGHQGIGRRTRASAVNNKAQIDVIRLLDRAHSRGNFSFTNTNGLGFFALHLAHVLGALGKGHLLFSCGRPARHLRQQSVVVRKQLLGVKR
eukprot:1009902-Prymnesium_polylepis.1